MQETVSSTI